jgi:hypothetical protein
MIEWDLPCGSCIPISTAEQIPDERQSRADLTQLRR